MRPKIVTSFSLSLSLPLFPVLRRRRPHEKGRGRTPTTKPEKEEKMAAQRRRRGPPFWVSSGERRRTAKKKKKDIKVEWSDHLLGVLEVQNRMSVSQKALRFLSRCSSFKLSMRTEDHTLTRHDHRLSFSSLFCATTERRAPENRARERCDSKAQRRQHRESS